MDNSDPHAAGTPGMFDSRVKDLYEVLQVSPRADEETIQRVFRHLAKRFHPDNTESGNAERFSELMEAFQTLSDAEQRSRTASRAGASSTRARPRATSLPIATSGTASCRCSTLHGATIPTIQVSASSISSGCSTAPSST